MRLLRNDTSNQPESGQIVLALQPDIIGQDTKPLIVLGGDVNNDQQDDLVTINGEADSRAFGGSGRGTGLGSVAVQLNGDIGVCRADIVPPGGDGHVSIADVVAIIVAYGVPCSRCPEDIEPPGGDGHVTAEDINVVLAAFGPCAE
jgi:hypothetical protein